MLASIASSQQHSLLKRLTALNTGGKCEDLPTEPMTETNAAFYSASLGTIPTVRHAHYIGFCETLRDRAFRLTIVPLLYFHFRRMRTSVNP